MAEEVRTIRPCFLSYVSEMRSRNASGHISRTLSKCSMLNSHELMIENGVSRAV